MHELRGAFYPVNVCSSKWKQKPARRVLEALYIPTAPKWMSFPCANIHFGREKSLSICHPVQMRCALLDLCYSWHLNQECVVLSCVWLFPNEPCVWNYIKVTGSEPGTFRSGHVLRREHVDESNMWLVRTGWAPIYSINWHCAQKMCFCDRVNPKPACTLYLNDCYNHKRL